MLVLPNEGLPILMGRIWQVAESGYQHPVMILWVNDIEPDGATVYADLELASFTGYNPIVVTPADWTAPAVVGDVGRMTWGATPFEYTCTGGGQTVRGYAIFDPYTFKLLLVERFEESRDLVPGSVLGLLPQFTLGTYVPCP